MSISEDLKKLVRYGDYSLIAELYKEKHELLGDYRTVSSQYVEMVIKGERPASPGTAAEEVLEISIKYLEHKRNFIDELLTA
jgi:hypothetical protein